MQYSGIKIHVPTPEISELVQQKLFEEGCRWYTGGGVKHTCSHYLIVDSSYTIFHCGDDREFFLNKSEEKQVHYLQVLTGDDAGELFTYVGEGRVYYYLGDYAYWVGGGELRNTHWGGIHRFSQVEAYLIDVNENRITEEDSCMGSEVNEMPELEAGKHVVKIRYSYEDDGRFYLVLENKMGQLYGKVINSQEDWTSNLFGNGLILEVHSLPLSGYNSFKPNSYNESTLIWQRNPNAKRKAEIEKQIEELQKELESL
ncbi:MAG: hypothetical protein GOVbin4162_101 [Prokaryotic dsDNA virus sp.]|nr:MAG: hypothetical protein GOVbin4162_101 [Prokaryotic dsDNA virus sp.]|tara:strand:- start:8504 stop:9274 length:771 start_codon:yes stop_codon:yes gene_type:complete